MTYDDSLQAGIDQKRPRVDSLIAKTIATLEILSRADSPVGVTAISRALDIDKSNVHRILASLMELGYVDKEDDTGRYSATLRLWEHGSAIIARHTVKRAAQPFLRSLRQSTSESSFLTMIQGTEILYLERLDALYPIVAQIQVGSRAPAHRTASGKALLAFQPDLQAILKRVESTRPKSEAFDMDLLLKEFAEIRRLGYASSQNAAIAGLSAVAAPVLMRGRAPTVAIGVGGISARFESENFAGILRAVQNSAVGISEALGG